MLPITHDFLSCVTVISQLILSSFLSGLNHLFLFASLIIVFIACVLLSVFVLDLNK